MEATKINLQVGDRVIIDPAFKKVGGMSANIVDIKKGRYKVNVYPKYINPKYIKLKYIQKTLWN